MFLSLSLLTLISRPVFLLLPSFALTSNECGRERYQASTKLLFPHPSCLDTSLYTLLSRFWFIDSLLLSVAHWTEKTTSPRACSPPHKFSFPRAIWLLNNYFPCHGFCPFYLLSRNMLFGSSKMKARTLNQCRHWTWERRWLNTGGLRIFLVIIGTLIKQFLNAMEFLFSCILLSLFMHVKHDFVLYNTLNCQSIVQNSTGSVFLQSACYASTRV